MRSVILRTGAARLAMSLVYTRLTGRPATYAMAPLTDVMTSTAQLPTGAWVRVRSTLAGICGSDLKTLRLQISTRAENQARRRANSGPMFLGHETVGEVIEVSSACAWARPGQRVVMIPHVSCAVLGQPSCAFCQDGLPLLCERRDEAMANTGQGAGWSDQFVRHESQLFQIDERIPDEVAVLFEPLGCALHCILRAPPKQGEAALIIGAGTIGLAAVAMLHALRRNTRIAVVVRYPHQAEAAKRAGADTAIQASPEDAYEALAAMLKTGISGRRRSNRVLVGGFDVVYDTVGSASTLHHALRWLRPRGTLVLEGVNQFPGSLDRSPIWHREIAIVGALGHGIEVWENQKLHTYQLVSSWILDGRLDPSGLLTHQVPFERYRDAVRIAAEKSRWKSIKVALRFAAPASP